jgi:hypothetical protein
MGARRVGHPHHIAGAAAVAKEAIDGVRQVGLGEVRAEQTGVLRPALDAHGQVERAALGDADERGDVGAQRSDPAYARVVPLENHARCAVGKHRPSPE